MFSDKITILNQTVLECLSETDEVKLVKAFTVVGLKVLEADFGFVWLNSSESNKLELVYKSPNLPYNPLPPREEGRNYKVLDSSIPDFVEDVKKRYDEYDVSEYMKSFVIIPLAYKKNVFGTMVICFEKKELFSREKKILSTFIGNSIAQAITINRLVSSEHAARLKSERQEAYFRALVENSHEVIMLIDKKGVISYVNSSVITIYGLEINDVIGREISEFILNSNPEKTTIAVDDILRNHNTNTVREFKYLHKDGKVLTLETTFCKMEDSVAEGILVNIRDITEQKKAEILKETQILLNEEKLKTEFISNATHEFRTPLAIIRGNAELAMLDFAYVPSSGKTKAIEKSFKAINYEIEHLSNVLSDLALITSKGIKTKYKIIPKELDLTALISLIAERYSVLADKRKISIQTTSSQKIKILGEEAYLEKLFTNLIRNAITYGKDGGYIKIEMNNRKDHVEIKISDNGIGIAEEDLPYIFERFYRVDKSRNSHKNTGVGLSICKLVLDYHGGTITATSILGEGSVFIITIPLNKL